MAVAIKRIASTYQTTNDIRDLVFEHFLGSVIQHKLVSSPRPTTDSNTEINTRQGPIDKVFEIPELLEGILSKLPTTELVKASRTNKTFWTVMRMSPIIQSKLFLRPVHPTTTVKLNVFIGEYIPVVKPNEYVVAGLNPLLQVRDSFPLKLIAGMSPQDINHIVFFNPRITLASRWTNMYLTNPPCTKVRIRLVYSSCHSTIIGANAMHYHITADRTIYREDGVTLGMLMEAAYLDGRTISTAYVPGTGLRSVKSFANNSVADHIRRWEEKSQCCKLQLDLDETLIKLVGVALPTREDSQGWEEWGLGLARQHYYEWPEDEFSVEVIPGKFASNDVERFGRHNSP